MAFLKIFLYICAPFIVWWFSSRLFLRRGMTPNDSHALGIGLGVCTLGAAIAFIVMTTERLYA
ncbi:MAG: hypothetical protein QM617_10385 [Comamonas sp.]